MTDPVRFERCEIQGKRYYQVYRPGQQSLLLPSVTTVLGVLDKGLAPWAARVAVEHLSKSLPVGQVLSATDLRRVAAAARTRHLDIANEAARAGTAIHEHCEQFVLTGETPDVSGDLPGVEDCVCRFVDWWPRQRMTVLATELPIFWVGPTGQGFAGTLDILAQAEDGSLVVLDLKSSKTSASLNLWYLQASSYAAGVVHRLGIPAPERVVIIHVPRFGTGIRTYALCKREIEAHFGIFQHSLKLHYWISEKPSSMVQKRFRKLQVGIPETQK